MHMANILTEKALANFLEIDLQGGKSRKISHWINRGLKHIDLSGDRYFFETDVVDFFKKVQQETNPPQEFQGPFLT